MKAKHPQPNWFTPCFILGLSCAVLLTSAPSSFGQTTKWKFVAVGDTRSSVGSEVINTAIVQELAKEIVRQGAAFVIVPGDLVYSGSSSAFTMWKTAMAPVYQAHIPVLPVLGNHDADDVPAWGQIFGPDVPQNGPAGEVGRTFAFTYQSVLVLGLDNYVTPGRVNQAWVNSVLQANTLPHVFAFGHLPAFKANHADCLDDYPTERDTFWNSLKKANVGAYFCGHDHFYDHARIDDGDGDVNNDVHQLIVGCGGAPFHTSYAYDGINAPWRPIGVSHEQEYGYTVVEIDGLTATFTFYKRTGPSTYAATSDVWSYTVNTGPQPLPAPTGLTAVAGNATVTLSWDEVTGARSYNVKRATSAAGPFGIVGPGITGLNYADNTVQNGLSYYYVVSAVNEVGEGANSAPVSATPNVPPPPAPTGVMATAGDAQVQLTWTGSSGAGSYNVKRALNASGPYTTIRSVTGSSFTDTTVANGTTYYYVVSAVNGGGESANSDYVSATPKAPPLPAPTGLAATSGPRAGQITLSWNKTPGAISYRVKRSSVLGGPYTLIKSVPKPTYTDGKLRSKAAYYYVVTAVNGSGESAPSAEKSATAK